MTDEVFPRFRNDDDRLKVAEAMRDRANADESYTLYCVLPSPGTGFDTGVPAERHKVFYVEDEISRVPGHVYSPAGMAEYRNTNICEFCFDQACPEEDEESEDATDTPIPTE